MNEQEWLECSDSEQLLGFLDEQFEIIYREAQKVENSEGIDAETDPTAKAFERKLRLFAIVDPIV